MYCTVIQGIAFEKVVVGEIMTLNVCQGHQKWQYSIGRVSSLLSAVSVFLFSHHFQDITETCSQYVSACDREQSICLVVTVKTVSHTISCLSLIASQLQQAHYWQRVANGAFQLLLGNGVDVDVRDNDGMSALMWCCHDDRVDHVRLLLNQVGRARLSDADVTGRTCLHWSVRRTEPLRCLQVAVRTYSVFSDCEIQYYIHYHSIWQTLQRMHTLDCMTSYAFSLQLIRVQVRGINLLYYFGVIGYTV